MQSKPPKLCDTDSDIFNYIEQFYNPRKRRKLKMLHQSTLS